MNLIENVTINVAHRATERAPFGPGFAPALAEAAARMEIHGSSFHDPGPDFTLFVLLDADHREIARRRVDGY